MIYAILGLCIFTSLVILGFHAVTRHGMLLSFLGQDSKVEDKREELEFELIDDTMQCVEDFLNEFNSMMSDKSTQKHDDWEYIKLIQDLAQAINKRNEMFEDDLAQAFIGGTRKEEGIFKKIFSPIATPFSECTTCMSSIWSIIVFGLWFISPMFLILVAPLAVAGFIQFFNAIKFKNV